MSIFVCIYVDICSVLLDLNMLNRNIVLVSPYKVRTELEVLEILNLTKLWMVRENDYSIFFFIVGKC